MRNLFLWVNLLVVMNVAAQRIKPYYGPFPDPAPIRNMLFYLQRTIDRNTVIYELNVDMNGEINLKSPVKYYWILFEQGGAIRPLTFAQANFAFGLESRLLDKEKKIFQLNLVSYPKVNLFLKRPPNSHRFQVFTHIDGRETVLSKIHVNIIGGTYLKPQVSSLTISGRLYGTDSIITARILPDRR